MAAFADEVTSQISDNWPAFLYILTVCVSSVFFLRERRAETRLLKEASSALHEQIEIRFERLERIIREEAGSRPMRHDHKFGSATARRVRHPTAAFDTNQAGDHKFILSMPAKAAQRLEGNRRSR